MAVVSALPEPNDTDPQGPRGAPEPRPAPGTVTVSRCMGALVAVLVLACAVLTGCASGSTPPAGATTSGTQASPGGGGSSSAGDTETFDSPAVEPTTPDTSDGSGSNGNPGISVARLPIGGDSQDDATDPLLQCAHVSWIASQDGQIPPGTGVEITGVTFDPAAFEAVGSGCGAQRPSCLRHVFRTSALQCDLAVRAVGDVPPDASPSLGLGGLVFCPDDASPVCRRFVAALGQEQQLSVSLNVPQVPAGPTDTTADTTTDTATDSTTGPGSDTATTAPTDSTTTASSGG
ncbi:hypothetical protein ABEG17_17280 [Pedococcus sp. KACC 23699]|uniref:LppP/LprE family lipoprotein n=1 Tax=Pedococcus sp. KACC 23699 TaxID=3149228 RepID=A0AAU7JSM6_9MICO